MEDTRKRGVKRKRETHAGTEDVASRLAAKLHHGLKEIKKATKKVKAFETQRIVKKLKSTREGGNESNIKNLEEQLEYLKHINLDDLAVRSLRSKVKKDRLLWKDEICQEAVSSQLASSRDKLPSSASTVQTLVESRLLSSKILSLEVADVIRALKVVLGVMRQETPVDDDHGEASDIEDGEEMEEDDKPALKAPQSKRKAVVDAGDVEASEDERDEEDGDEVASWTGFDGIAGDFERSAEAKDQESGSPRSQNEEEQSYASDDYSRSNSSQHRSPTKAAQRSNTTVSKPRPGKAGESTFLPSLTVGFISGSDSEWSESEAKFADLPVKKNRRGQRARKAIWEKKYGKNANHLRKLRENDVRGDAARPSRGFGQRGGGRGGPRGGRGSVVTAHDRRPVTISEPTPHNRIRDPHLKHTSSQARGVDRDGKTPSFTPNVRPYPPRTGGFGRVEESAKPLHPSWEAKRRLKEKESPAIVPSMGTRIKFT